MMTPLRLKPFKTLFNSYVPFNYIITILLLGLASYANSLTASLLFDDDLAVRSDLSDNLYSVQGFFRTSRWFADITFALNRHLHQEQVMGYHLFNLALHLSSAVIIYLMLRKIIEALQQSWHFSVEDEKVSFLMSFIPFVSAALFVCHPVQTQAVTYVVQRYTSMSTLLYLGSLLTYLQARLAFNDERTKLFVCICSSVSFFLALLAMKSKEIAFTLPLMMAAFEYALFNGRLIKNRIFLALGAGLLLVIPVQLLFVTAGGSENLLDHLNAVTAETQSISRVDYLFTQFRVVATYLRLLVLPINQNMDYDYPIYHSLLNPQVLLGLMLHVILAGTALTLFVLSRRRLKSADPATGIVMRLVALGIFWFYLALSVESSVIPIKDVMFEHRIYLPSVGFFMASTAGIAGLAASRRRYQQILCSLIALLCCILVTATIARNRVWSSELGMWQDVLEKSPHKARAWAAVGRIYYTKLMPEKAVVHLVKALELDPASKKNWLGLNDAVAIINRYRGRCTDGRKYYSLAMINPAYMNLWWAITYNNLGLAYELQDNLPLAQNYYKKSTNTYPELDISWANLAVISARLNDTSLVADALKRLDTINPGMKQAVAEQIHFRDAPGQYFQNLIK